MSLLLWNKCFITANIEVPNCKIFHIKERAPSLSFVSFWRKVSQHINRNQSLSVATCENAQWSESTSQPTSQPQPHSLATWLESTSLHQFWQSASILNRRGVSNLIPKQQRPLTKRRRIRGHLFSFSLQLSSSTLWRQSSLEEKRRPGSIRWSYVTASSTWSTWAPTHSTCQPGDFSDPTSSAQSGCASGSLSPPGTTWSPLPSPSRDISSSAGQLPATILEGGRGAGRSSTRSLSSSASSVEPSLHWRGSQVWPSWDAWARRRSFGMLCCLCKTVLSVSHFPIFTDWFCSGVPDHYWSSGTTWKTFTPLCPRVVWSYDNPSGPLHVFSST